jgi:ATP/ADP translocase
LHAAHPARSPSLSPQVRVKGKAAIDVICNPLGKSGGALIQQFMVRVRARAGSLGGNRDAAWALLLH